MERIFFRYEPIVLTSTGSTIGYEQLARLSGGGNALWIQQLSLSQQQKLTREAVAQASAFAQGSNRLVSINAFPHLLSETAELVSRHPGLVLEVHEDVPMNRLMALMEDYQELWLAIDDVNCREDLEVFDLCLNTPRRLIVKTSHHVFGQVMNGAIEHLGDLLRHPFVVVEGADPKSLETLWFKGFPFAQGRRLQGARLVESRLKLAIPSESDSHIDPHCDGILGYDERLLYDRGAT